MIDETMLDRLEKIDEAVDILLAARSALWMLGFEWERDRDALFDILNELGRERDACVQDAIADARVALDEIEGMHLLMEIEDLRVFR